MIVFAAARHDHRRLLEALAEGVGTRVIVGSSSSGEFCAGSSFSGSASALALRSESMHFALGIGHDLRADPAAAAAEVVSTFRGQRESAEPMPHHCALVMTDALAGHADVVVEELSMATGGYYRFFGGSAGDDAQFARTLVFAGTEACTDAIVALEIRSLFPVGVGVADGWVPAGEPLRVTAVQGARLLSLNAAPAVHAFEDHAEATGQVFDPQHPMPFFLHNVLGIREGDEYRLRLPLSVDADGSISCAAAIPERAVVQLMKTSQESSILAARQATRAALLGADGRRPAGSLLLECVATRLRLGDGFGEQLKACAEMLGSTLSAGCNTQGQIARAEGQFSGFHNCTTVVAVFPA